MWKHLTKRAPYHILDKQLIDLFCRNVIKEISKELRFKKFDEFEELIEMGCQVEQALIDYGILKINYEKTYKESSSSSNHNKKTPVWAQNKNIVNDGVVDTKTTKSSQPIYNIKVSSFDKGK